MNFIGSNKKSPRGRKLIRIFKRRINKKRRALIARGLDYRSAQLQSRNDLGYVWREGRKGRLKVD